MRYVLSMIVATRQEDQTRRRFERKLKRYLRPGRQRAVPVRRTAGKKTITLGELVTMPAHDITHVFNNEAMLAISHAIEDLAAEVREGELLSTFQKIENFLDQRKRYAGLARDLDAVRVWASGRPPARAGKIDFVPIFRKELQRYWVVLFASPRAHAVLVCRQANEAEHFDDKVFTGFYSFNPFLVESIRRHFNLISCGLDGLVAGWERDFQMPSISLQDIRRLLPSQALARAA